MASAATAVTAHASCCCSTAPATSACTFGSHEPPIRTLFGWGSLLSSASGAHQAGGWGWGWGYPAWPSTHAAGALATAQVGVTCAWWAHPCAASTASTACGHAANTRYANNWNYTRFAYLHIMYIFTYLNVFVRKPQMLFWSESIICAARGCFCHHGADKGQ